MIADNFKMIIIFKFLNWISVQWLTKGPLVRATQHFYLNFQFKKKFNYMYMTKFFLNIALTHYKTYLVRKF